MLNSVQLEQLTAAYPILLDLATPLHQQLERDAQWTRASTAQLLFDVGSPCENFIMLTSGSVRVVKPGDNGREILLYRVGPGDACMLTLSCLLGNTPYSARGFVESDVSGVCVSRPLFIEMVEGSQAFRFFVFQLFSERLIQLMELVEAVAFGKLDQRLASLLLSKGATIKVTHQMLADELGSSREVVSRILEDFAQQDALALERGGIRILDVRALHQLAGLCDRGHRHSH